MGVGVAGYWDFFPAPPDWGCPPCWGFARVNGISRTRCRGRLAVLRAIFRSPKHSNVLPIKVSGSGFTDGVAHRANKAAVYNRYLITSADPLYDPDFEPEQVLLRPTFASGWWLADLIHRDNPHTVVMSSASSKSALATAHQLRRLGNHRLIGLTSNRNLPFVRDTALYDGVLDYEDVASLSTSAPTIYADFLGRESLTTKVHDLVGESLIRSVLFGATDWSDKPGGVQPISRRVRGPAPEIFFTPGYRDARHREDPGLSAAVPEDMRACLCPRRPRRSFLTIRDVRGSGSNYCESGGNHSGLSLKIAWPRFQVPPSS